MRLSAPTPLAGREELVRSLSHWTGQARSGAGAVVLVGGEAGVGKTRLVREVLDLSELRTLTGRALAVTSVPYHPFAAALRDAFRAGLRPLVEKMRLAGELRRILPELGEAPPGQADTGLLQESLFEAFSSIARRQPCCLMLEDLQWSDHATFDFLSVLADRLIDQPLLIIGIYRGDEVPDGHPLRRLKDGLRRSGQLHEIKVEGLERDESALLVRSLLGREPAPALVDELHAKTKGLPLLLEEICRALEEKDVLVEERGQLKLRPGQVLPLPESVRDALMLRLSQLTSDARSFLDTAAVIGVRFDLGLVSQLCGLPHAFSVLSAAGILSEVEGNTGQGAFRHSLLREAVLSSMEWSRRRELNLQAAAALGSAHGPPEAVARHYLAAGAPRDARSYFVKAAEQACSVSAHRDSALLYKEALELWPAEQDPDLRLAAMRQLAYCAQLGGHTEEAVAVLRDVLQVLQPGDHLTRAQAFRSLATAYALQGASEDAAEARREASKAYELAKNPVEAARELLALAEIHTAAARTVAAEQAATEALNLAGKAESADLQSLALSSIGLIRAVRGQIEQAHRDVQAAMDIAVRQQSPEVSAAAYRSLAYIHEYGSAYQAACEAFAALMDYCAEQKLDLQAQSCLGCMAYAYYRRGEWGQAHKICRGVVTNKRSPLFPRAVASGVLSLYHTQRGELKQGKKYAVECDKLRQQLGVVSMEFYCRWAFGLIAQYENRPAAAEQHFRALLLLAKDTEDHVEVAASIFPAVSFFSRRGMKQEVNRCVEVLSAVCSHSANAEPFAALGFALGEAALMHGDFTQAAAHLRQALERLETIGVPLEAAYASWRAGEAHALAEDRAAALRYLNRSYRTMRRLGARAPAAEVAGSLQRLGVPVEDPRRSQAQERGEWQGLTRREREVAEFIAGGLTNKEIAKKLFVSPRTVDMHVGNILSRLDCRTRSEAVQKLSRMGRLEA